VPSHLTERVTVIQQAAEQIDALIQDLLDTTRLAGGRLSVSPKMLDATATVVRSVEALRPLADAGHVTLRMDIPRGGLTVFADPDRVSQLLSNLIGNAIKFTPPDGSVALSVRPDGQDVVFIVSDTGDGIAPDELPHVFERFYQVPRGARRAVRHGAGLGLPISRGIVEAHGGHIWIESTLGAGTTVRFSLPVAPPR
jgi:signal transduction histidine kinase